MKVDIETNGKLIQIELNHVTQLCGQNICCKTDIIVVLAKYFSSEKYKEYELSRGDRILVDGEVVSRGMFNTKVISSKKDLATEVKLAKNTMFMDFLKVKLDEFEVQQEMRGIDDLLTKIYLRINNNLAASIGGVELTYSLSSIWDMIQKSEMHGNDDEYIENKKEMDLINIYLNLLEELLKKTPCQYLIIFENIDHMIKTDEYKMVIDRCLYMASKYNLYFLFTTSLAGYVVINEKIVEGITVFNEEIFTFPECDKICQYINDNYPCNKSFVEKDLCDSLEKICHDIGRTNYLIEDYQMVICKLINDTIVEKTFKKNISNSAEAYFLTH